MGMAKRRHFRTAAPLGLREPPVLLALAVVRNTDQALTASGGGKRVIRGQPQIKTDVDTKSSFI